MKYTQETKVRTLTRKENSPDNQPVLQEIFSGTLKQDVDVT